MNLRCLSTFVVASLLSLPVACADIAPPPVRVQPVVKKPTKPIPAQHQDGRDAVSQARKDATIADMLKKARGGETPGKGPGMDESVTEIQLGGQCGFAGCSTTTLVAFTLRTRGANTMTQTVMALVTCGPVPSTPCVVAPAEVRASQPGTPVGSAAQ